MVSMLRLRVGIHGSFSLFLDRLEELYQGGGFVAGRGKNLQGIPQLYHDFTPQIKCRPRRYILDPGWLRDLAGLIKSVGLSNRAAT